MHYVDTEAVRVSNTTKELRSMVREMLDEENVGFTDWENDFLDSVWEWDGYYSPKQEATIVKIYREKM